MSDEWPADEFDARLSRAPRVVVLFHASWCAPSRILLPDFEEADAESPIPFALADVSDASDPRWRAHRLARTPTVAYFEHGEELERAEATRTEGLSADKLHGFLDAVASLQEPEFNERWHLKQRARRRAKARRVRTG